MGCGCGTTKAKKIAAKQAVNNTSNTPSSTPTKRVAEIRRVIKRPMR